MRMDRRRCNGVSRLVGIAAFSVWLGAAAIAGVSADTTAPPQEKTPLQKSGAGKLDAELQAALRAAPDPAQWPNQNAALLLDIGSVTVKPDGTTVAVYRLTYKLLNERGRDQYAEVNKSYNASYQSLRILEARTIKKDGTILTVKPEDLRVAVPFSDYPMYDDARLLGFSFPGVEAGCILDYTWEETTRPLLMPGQFWTYWGFSGLEPVGLSRYTLTVPASKPLRYQSYNDPTLKPEIVASKDGKTKTYTWERRNLPPIALEPAMPPIADARIWLEVSSIASWEEIARWYWNLQKPQTAASAEIRATVEKLTRDKKTEAEKARAIYEWVANRTRYVGLEFGISAYRPHKAADVHSKMYGDCKDKATLLITMLGLAGIPAHPALLRAGDPRPVSASLPTLNAFNHCIALARIGDQEVWLDATADHCPYGDIPSANRGAEALVVREGNGAFQTVPRYAAEQNGVEAVVRVKVRPDGSADLTAEIALRGAASQNMRAYLRALTPDKRREYLKGMAQVFATGGEVKDSRLPDEDDRAEPLRIQLTIAAANFAKPIGSLLLLPIGGNAAGPQTNPFDTPRRVWPIVERDATLSRTEMVFMLPEGYTVSEAPADADLRCPIQTYRRALVKSPDGRSLTVTETVQEIPGTVPAQEVGQVKAYYDALLKLRATADQVILKKE